MPNARCPSALFEPSLGADDQGRARRLPALVGCAERSREVTTMRVVGWWSRPALVAVLVCAVLSAVGCGAGDAEEVGQTVRSDVAFAQVDLADAAGAGSVVAASDRFGLQVLAGSDATTNLVFSPASAFVALAMLG
jgi:hypothetical protein